VAPPAGIRRLGNWIESYQEYTEILPSPALFRKWVAIFFVAAAMERKIWVRTMGSALYPNLYVFLVGPPGIGKGVAVHPAEVLMREVPEVHVGPSDMTTASLIDALNESVRRIILMDASEPFVEFHSLTVVSRELGVLIPGWETSLMNNLTDIYDGFTVDQKRRGKDLRIKIKSPQINLLGACTPAYLNEVMPAGAWDQGFISRTILVYSGDRVSRDPFLDEGLGPAAGRLHADLLHDLKTIALEYGQMSFTTPAAAAIKEWIRGGCKPEPAHQKLQYYNSRRIAHMLKLCMVSSIARRGNKIIEVEDYAQALDWIMEAERYMPDIFKSMISGGDSNAMEEAWNYVWLLYAKEKKPIAEHRVVHFLRERVPAHSVMRVIDVMVRGRMFVIEAGDKGFVGYKPASREARLTGDSTE
jgi:Protein of unknown function (DUF3987)